MKFATRILYQKCIKQKSVFLKSDSDPAVLCLNESVNFYLHLQYFVTDLCELGAENLHLMPLCKYEINQTGAVEAILLFRA